jgi:hypothetical protein
MFPCGGHLGNEVELSDIIFEGDHPTTQHLGKYTQHNEVSTYHNPVVTLHSVVLAQRKKLLSSSNEIST